MKENQLFPTSENELPFGRDKFTLILVDIENLLIPYYQDFSQEPCDPLKSIIFPKLMEHVEYPYQIFWGGNESYKKYIKHTPNEEFLITQKKKMNPHNKHLLNCSADPYLLAMGMEWLIRYYPYIHKIFIASGDIDFYPLHRRAHELGIPTQLLCYSSVQLHSTYLQMSAIRCISFLKPDYNLAKIKAQYMNPNHL